MSRLFSTRWDASRPAKSARRFIPETEFLEDRTLPAPLTGGTGPGGFVLASGGASSPLQLWLDASDAPTVVLSGGTVSQWSDRSGNGFNATAPTVAAQPMYNLTALNSEPAIRFSGSPTLLAVSPSLVVSRPYTIYTVDQYWNNTHGRSVTSNSGGNNWLTGKWNGDNVNYANGWVSLNTNTDGLQTATNFVPVVGDTVGDVTANSSHYYRNSLDVTDPGGTAPSGAPGQLALGGGTQGGCCAEWSTVDISEVIVFNQVLNSAQRIIVDNYLASKYTIPINASTGNTHYTGNLAANGNYSTDVFGVGEVDAADTVTNAGDDGLGITSTTLSPGQWVLAGNNVAVNSLVSTNLPASELQRWGRVWYVQNTGGASAALTFDLTNGGGLPASPNGYHLLYSATDPNAGGTFTALNIPATVVGNQISFNVPAGLLNTGYFTIGYDKPVADLSIVKTASAPTVTAGQTLIYTIVVRNNGPSVATGVSVTDNFAAIVTSANWTAAASAGVTGVPAGAQSGNINLSGLTLPNGGIITFTVTVAVSPTALGTLTNTATVSAAAPVIDPNLANNTATVTDAIIPSGPEIFATGTGPGTIATVNVYTAGTGQFVSALQPFGGFTGGVSVAVGDVNGDGLADIICGAGPGGGPQVVVIDGKTGSILNSFFAFGGSSLLSNGSATATAGGAASAFTFHGGVFVAAGDLFGNGYDDIIVGAGAGGGPQVNVYDGKTGQLVSSFYAFAPNFTGGVRVAVADLYGTRKPEIICAAGPGGGPQVTVWDGLGQTLLASFDAFAPSFTGGVYVGGGDVLGIGRADIVCGAGSGGGPQVTIYDGKSLSLVSSFDAFAAGFKGGVRVSTEGMPGQKQEVLTGAGTGGGPQVAIFDASTLALLGSFFAYSPGFNGGIFVGG